jgi:hypothetical protein
MDLSAQYFRGLEVKTASSHVLHLLKLLEHAIDFLHASTGCNAAFAGGFDEFGLAAL